MMERLEAFLNRFIGPVAQKLSESDNIQSIAEGFMRASPITFGVFLFAIIGNFPVTAFTDWLTAIGLKSSFDAVMNAGLNILALYVSFTVAFSFAKRKGDNEVACGLLSLLSFLIIVPQTVAGTEGDVTAFSIAYLGGNGILAALIVALLIANIFHVLSKRGLKFNMPEGVPPMVSESLEPMFMAMIISCIAFCIQAGFSYTPFGNFVDFFQVVIGGVLTNFVLSVPFIIGLVFIANLIWFFGIHPNTVYSPFTAMAMVLVVTNMSDFAAGKPLTYLTVSLVYFFAGFGGNGNTLGLCFSMFSAKSERYKKMLKISLIPNLFNINEPLIFGMPVMLNPIFFIPMTCSCVIMGILGYFAIEIFPFVYNPSVSLIPFTCPFFVKALLGGGITMLVISLVLLAVNTLIYFPFFKIADQKACDEEAAAEAAEAEAVLKGGDQHE